MTLDLPTVNILYQPKSDWRSLAQGKVRVARDIQVDWKKFSPDQYLFSHSSIVASCVVGDNCHYVMSPTDELINNNGNGWSNEVLTATFRSFCGAENYYEHVQVPELSKGKILDAVVRPLRYRNKKGQQADVYWCDILVATDRKHSQMVRRIEAGELGTMSMGCVANICVCSKCGREFTDDQENCYHLDHELMSYFKGDDGEMHIVAELCGRTYIDEKGNKVGDPDSMKFIEASWVERPAFRGAVLNHFVSDVPKSAKQIKAKSTAQLQDIVNDIFRVRVADSDGMMVLRVAWSELRRRRNLAISDRVARRHLSNIVLP